MHGASRTPFPGADLYTYPRGRPPRPPAEPPPAIAHRPVSRADERPLTRDLPGQGRALIYEGNLNSYQDQARRRNDLRKEVNRLRFVPLLIGGWTMPR
jgi:hypothetical protein